MDPARLSMTLVLLLGLGGIGGAVRACASASKAGGNAARVSSRAFKVTPKLGARLTRPTRVVPARRLGRRQVGAAVVGGSLSDDVARGANTVRGSAAAGDDVALGSGRLSTKGGGGSKVGEGASNGLDVAGAATDDDD